MDRLLPVILLSLLFLQTNAQYSCVDPAYENKLRTLLDLDVPTIDVDTLSDDLSAYIILDAREPEEYAVSHIPGARNIGFRHFDPDEDLNGIPAGAKIAVYCSVGYRSEKVVRSLRKRGYRNASNVFGSIFEWVNRGYPVIDPEGNQTRSIHTYSRRWSRWVSSPLMEKTW